MKISAVLIGKNEQELLGRCLESVKGLDEIIFCDTGSTDKTVEIATKYCKEVYFFEWNDRFCDARNAAKSHATGDWILSIDCDEILHDVNAVREAVALAEARSAKAVDVRLISEGDGQEFSFPRLFKNVPEVWWEGAVHNHISVNGETLGNVRITVGYSPAHLQDPERSLRILKKEVERDPSNPRNLFYLGREYWYKRNYEDCVITMGKYVQLAYFQAEKADAFLVMARAYWEMKDSESAKDACLQAIKINPNFKEACKFMADLIRKDTTKYRESNVRQWELMVGGATNEDVLFVRKIE